MREIEGKNIIAVIPARGGSKGVPRKNLRLVCGKPLIAYAIQAGLGSPSIERVIVSTDDEEIAEVARRYGAEVPFMRPAGLAGDSVPDQPVFMHAVGWLEDNGYRPDFVLNLRATTPMKTAGDVEAVIMKWTTSGCDCVRTVTRAKHHPYWMIKPDGDRCVQFVDGIDLERYHQRQLLPAAYYFNGVVDGMARDRVMSGGPMYGGDVRFVEVPEERAVDIDTEMDLKLCEYFMVNRNV